MQFEKILKENKFTLAVGLPANDLDMVKAAIDGGADAVKFNLNLGGPFGSFSENREFIEGTMKLCEGKILVGANMGNADAYVSPEERDLLEDMGVDFVECFADCLPPFMLKSKKLSKLIAFHDEIDSLLDVIDKSEVSVVEASIVPHTEYGTAVRYFDLLRYRKITQAIQTPVLVPAQRSILPEEVAALAECGVKAIMIGANVMTGRDAVSVKAATMAFKKCIEEL